MHSNGQHDHLFFDIAVRKTELFRHQRNRVFIGSRRFSKSLTNDKVFRSVCDRLAVYEATYTTSLNATSDMNHLSTFNRSGRRDEKQKDGSG